MIWQRSGSAWLFLTLIVIFQHHDHSIYTDGDPYSQTDGRLTGAEQVVTAIKRFRFSLVFVWE